VVELLVALTLPPPPASTFIRGASDDDFVEVEVGLVLIMADWDVSKLGDAEEDGTADVTMGDPPSDSSSGVPTDMTSESSGSDFILDVSTELFELMPVDANDSNKSSVVPSSQKLSPKSKFAFWEARDKLELPEEALVDSTLNIVESHLW